MTNEERLVELIDGKTNTMRFQNSDHWFDFQQRCEEIADYLLKNGAIVLPCRVEDTIYVVSNGTIIETEVLKVAYEESIEHSGYVSQGVYAVVGNTLQRFDFSEFGKTVFLTREEAEKALKECEENRTAQI